MCPAPTPVIVRQVVEQVAALYDLISQDTIVFNKMLWQEEERHAAGELPASSE